MMVLVLFGGTALVISGVFACLLRVVVSAPDPEQLELPDEAGGDLALLENCSPDQCRRELRAHLRRVRRHYNALEGAVKYLMLTSPVNRPDLARALVCCRLTFEVAMLAVRGQMLLNAIGVSPVRPGVLVRAMAGMRETVRAAMF